MTSKDQLFKAILLDVNFWHFLADSRHCDDLSRLELCNICELNFQPLNNAKFKYKYHLLKYVISDEEAIVSIEV